MNQLRISTIVSVLLVFISGSICAQKHQAGVMFGYGKTNSTNAFRPLLFPVNEPYEYTVLDNNFNIGICYYYTPAKYSFSVKTGLNFDFWKKNNRTSAGFLNIPLGIDFSLGNKFRFIYGFGIYTCLLISKTGYLDMNNPRLGFEANLGVEYPLSSKLSLCAGYQHNIGITVFYRTLNVSPGGNHYVTEYRRTDAIIIVSVKYSFL